MNRVYHSSLKSLRWYLQIFKEIIFFFFKLRFIEIDDAIIRHQFLFITRTVLVHPNLSKQLLLRHDEFRSENMFKNIVLVNIWNCNQHNLVLIEKRLFLSNSISGPNRKCNRFTYIFYLNTLWTSNHLAKVWLLIENSIN